MINFAELISFFFYIVLLIICTFIVVHASLQIKNSTYTFKIDEAKSPFNKKKMKKVLIVAVIFFAVLFFKIITFSFYKTDQYSINNYKDTVQELNEALSLEFSAAKNKSFNTAEDIARFIYKQLPVKSMYYVGSNYEEMDKFSKYEIMQYNLSDFEDRPTIVTYDGVLMSVIKFREGCKYVNRRNIAKSDCIIAVDVNHYTKPNQIGQDRTIFAVDGENYTIKTDPNFFRK